MYQNQDKTISLLPAFRSTIVGQLEQEINRCGGIGKSPAEVEQYIYDSIHTKDEYLEKVGKMIVGLQQKQQQQQNHPQQGMPPGQMQYGIRQQFQPQGQYIQYQQQQGQQPTAVLIQTGQGPVGPAQIIRGPPIMQAGINVRQLPPDHMLQGQPHYRQGPPRSGMPTQQAPQHVAHGQVVSGQQQRGQFPGAVMMAQQPQQPQPNIVMGGPNNIIIGSKVQPPVPERGRQPPQVRPVPDMQQAPNQPPMGYPGQQQQQSYFKHQQAHQQGQFQNQGQQMPPHQIHHSPAYQGPPSVAAQHQSQNQQYASVSTPQAPQQPPSLPRQSRSFNQGTASPAVSIPLPPTGPSPLGPKGGGPASVGPPVMSPLMSHQHAPPSVQMAPQSQPPPVTASASEHVQQQEPETRSVQPPPPNVTAQQNHQATPEEIQEKLKQLAKYKEPLRMLIETYESHKDNSSTVSKMKRILDIISGQGCESMNILKKCEEACIQVVARYCPEPSVNQVFSNALSKVATTAENLSTQQPQAAKTGRDALSCISSRAFNSVSIDSNNMEVGDLGDDWKLQLASRTVPEEKLELGFPSIFQSFSHLSRAAQRELLFLSEKYDISCRSNPACSNGVPVDGGAEMNDMVAIDFVPTLRYLVDSGAPTVCILISPDYPESPDVPQVVFSPASDLNSRLAAIKRKFSAMYESVKVASVSDVSLIRLVTFYEASVLSESP